MGNFNEWMVRRGMATQARERVEKERRTTKIPSRMMYKIANDLREDQHATDTEPKLAEHLNYFPPGWD